MSARWWRRSKPGGVAYRPGQPAPGPRVRPRLRPPRQDRQGRRPRPRRDGPGARSCAHSARRSGPPAPGRAGRPARGSRRIAITPETPSASNRPVTPSLPRRIKGVLRRAQAPIARRRAADRPGPRRRLRTARTIRPAACAPPPASAPPSPACHYRACPNSGPSTAAPSPRSQALPPTPATAASFAANAACLGRTRRRSPRPLHRRLHRQPTRSRTQGLPQAPHRRRKAPQGRPHRYRAKAPHRPQRHDPRPNYYRIPAHEDSLQPRLGRDRNARAAGRSRPAGDVGGARHGHRSRRADPVPHAHRRRRQALRHRHCTRPLHPCLRAQRCRRGSARRRLAPARRFRLSVPSPS